MTAAKRTHGGARPNAGRASDGAKDLTKRTVMLDPATVRTATHAGEGNLSAGLRKIVGQYRIKTRDNP